MKFQKKIVLALFAFLLVVVAGYFHITQARKPRLQIRNFSGATITELTLEIGLVGAQPGEVKKEALPDLPQGGSHTFYFPPGDFYVDIAYVLRGRTQKLECGDVGRPWDLYFATVEADSDKTKCKLLTVIDGPR
jgi:hypothetical protein